jgi:hypothetical protein
MIAPMEDYPTPEEEGQPDASQVELRADIQKTIERVIAKESGEKPKSTWKDRLQTTGGCLVYLAFLLVPIVILVALFKRFDLIIDYVYPPSLWAYAIALLLVMPLCLLLAIFPKTRGWSGLGLLLCSYVFGFCTWILALGVAFVGAGIVWTIIGLCFYGVGVVLIAIIAAAIHGDWVVLGELVFGVILTYGVRALAHFLIDKYERARQ